MAFRVRIATAVDLFGLMIAIGFVAVVWIALLAIGELKVGGPIYNRIVLGKDLVADVLPPPEYVVEAYLNATLALHADGSLAVYRDRLSKLHDDYTKRHEYWRADRTYDPAITRRLTVDSDAEVARLWEEVELRFLPALERGDSSTALASYRAISDIYERHRVIIEQIVASATSYNAETKMSAAKTESNFMTAVWSVALIMLVLVFGGVAAIVLHVVRPISQMTAAMKLLAAGKLDFAIPYANRNDEVGLMARALDVFRGNAIEATALRERAAAQQARHEEELVEAWKQAVMANRTKSEFLASVSHELRTPLNAILGFSEVLERQFFGPLGSDRYLGYVRDIHTSGGHLLSLINDLLDLSKIEAGRFEFHPEEVDCMSIAREVVRLAQPRAAERGVGLRLDLPLRVQLLWGDQRAVRQVLFNLLSNGVKFTPDGGMVTLALQSWHDGVQFAVADTGIGMSDEDLRVALMPFGRIDNAFARAQEGTGLGLPIVKRIVELHGGDLQIRSRANVGTTVTARFRNLSQLSSPSVRIELASEMQ